MAAVARPRSLFGDLLRDELDAQGVSVRELARRVASGRDADETVDNVRRTLIRYLKGEVAPGAVARAELADALGIDVEAFADEAVQQARRVRLAEALLPLADVLFDLVRDVAKDRAVA